MRRTGGGSYPLIVGVIALGAVLAVWQLGEAPAPTAAPPSAAPPDAAVPTAAPDAEVPVPRLAWTLTGATLPTAADLASCLRAGGWDRVRVLGGKGRPLTITHGPLAMPLVLEAGADGVVVRSPLAEKRHLALSLHAAVTACAAEGATGLVDEVTGAHAEQRPSTRRDAGLPLPLLVAIEATPTALYTRGLGRLGLFDVLLLGPDSPRNRRTLERAAVAVLLADDPATTALTLGDRSVPLVGSEAAWWPADAPGGLRGLGSADAAFAPPALPAAPPTQAAPASAAAPPTASPPRRVRPALPPTAPRPAAAPVFRPEYR